MYGTKLNNNKSIIKGGELIRKYERHLQKVKEIEDRLESQEELISKLNKMNVENNKLLLQKGTETVLESLNQGGVKVNSIEEVRSMLAENKDLKKKLSELESLVKESENKATILVQEI